MKTKPLHVIIPVKNSPASTQRTIEAVIKSKTRFAFDLTVYDDFSEPETAELLDSLALRYGFKVIHLKDVTACPSPNYNLILQSAQSKALEKGAHVLIVESDVVVKEDTFNQLYENIVVLHRPGMIAAVTTDEQNVINYPYLFAAEIKTGIIPTNRHLSFCCTILSNSLLSAYDFKKLNPKKSWYDVFVSHKSIKLGFQNYLVTSCRVIHLPHSSRPWKKLKYTRPIEYYFKKIFCGLDKI